MIRETYIPIVEAIVGMPKPVIAAVNGAAAGAGLSIALACDLRYMSDDAVLMMAFSNIGLVPDCGGSWLLPRAVGYARAFELAATRPPRAPPTRRSRSGSCSACCRAKTCCRPRWSSPRSSRRGPTLALGWTKRLLRAAEQSSLADAMEMEAQLQASAVDTHDHAEGVAAFLEKRAPRFEGR